MANWYTTIRNRTGLLWGDRVHPQPAGAVLYARMVAAEVQQAASRIESLIPARQPGVPSRSPGGATQSPQPGRRHRLRPGGNGISWACESDPVLRTGAR